MRRAQAWWTILICLVLVSVTAADERDECEGLAAKYDAEVEVTLHDGTRVDLLSEEYAIEVEWAPKWQEAIGQAILYSIHTKREPAIILLLTDPETEWQHLYRAGLVCGKADITLFVERPQP